MFDRFARFRSDALKHLDQIRDFAQEHKYDTFSRNVEVFQDSLRHTEYNIAVIGHMKRGKSTLLNALLGRRDDLISPIDVKVCTAGIVQYFDIGEDGVEEHCLVYFHGTAEPTRVSFSQIGDYVREDRNPENRKDVRVVEVYGRFPLLNQAVTLVDTPGRGATAKHHEAMVDQFLPNADAIILPISADLPIERAEREFLEAIREQDKDRIFFVLTKCDELDNESVSEVEEYVQRQASEAGLVCRRLHKVSARDLYDARKRGDSDEDIVAIRDRCGIRQLEEDLEEYILKTSSENDVLHRRLRPVLDDIHSFCHGEIERLDVQIEGFNCDVLKLESELRQTKSGSESLRSERDKALNKFGRLWEREVARFQRELTRRADRISDGIVSRLQDRGFLHAVSNTMKLGPLVAKRVDDEVASCIYELEDKLAERIRELNDTLDDELSVYLKRSRVKNWSGSLGALTLSGGVVGSTAAGATTVLGAWGSAASAWAAYGSQVALAGETAASVGVLPGFWAWLWGAGSTSSTAAAAAAQTAQTAAFSTAMATTVGGIATGGVAIAAIWITKNLAHWGLTTLQENRIPTLVSDALTHAGEKIAEKLDQRRQDIKEDYERVIEDLIISHEERIEEILQAIKQNDPSLRERLIERKEYLEQFLTNNVSLEREMATLPQPTS